MVAMNDLPCLSCCDWSKGGPTCRDAAMADGSCHARRQNHKATSEAGRSLLMSEYRTALAVAGRSAGKIPPGAVVHRLQTAGVPGSLLVRVRDPDVRPVLEFAARWQDLGRHHALVLAGGSRQGKSFAAAWCAYRWGVGYSWNAGATGSNQEPFVWLAASELARVDNWSDHGSVVRLERAKKALFLVLDDVGKEATKAGAAALSDLMARRLESGRTTIITTNEPGQSFAATYGAHIVERIKEFATSWGPAELKKATELRGAA